MCIYIRCCVLFLGCLSHIHIHQGSVEGVWRGMAVGKGCGVDLFGGVGEHPWGIYLCLNFVLQEQIKGIIIFLGVLVCVHQ